MTNENGTEELETFLELWLAGLQGVVFQRRYKVFLQERGHAYEIRLARILNSIMYVTSILKMHVGFTDTVEIKGLTLYLPPLCRVRRESRGTVHF